MVDRNTFLDDNAALVHVNATSTSVHSLLRADEQRSMRSIILQSLYPWPAIAIIVLVLLLLPLAALVCVCGRLFYCCCGRRKRHSD
jgi:hypothetical protein